MIYSTKPVVLKDGREAMFRSPIPADAAELLSFLKTCAGETHFVLREPEECTETEEQEAAYLARVNQSSTDVMIVCEVDGQIAGTCQLSFQNRMKIRHRASIAIGLLRAYWNIGIGSAMMTELIALARKNDLLQLELEFIEGNERARHLYETMGFAIVATLPDAIRLKDGTLLNEYRMIKKL